LKIQELSNNYAREYQDYKAKAEQLTARKNRAENRLKALSIPSWIDTIVQPIADDLAKEFPDFEPHILGPFGLCTEVSIHFYRKGVPEEKRWAGGNVRSITFILGDLQKGEILIRNTSVDTGEFRPGTIGEMNGMNHPSVKIPEDADVSWLMTWVRETKT